MTENVLVVAAHPDDEVIGCGGTIARHAESGDKIHIVLLADGVSSRGGSGGLKERIQSAVKAAEILGAEEPIIKNLPDNRLDTLPLLDIVKELEKIVSRINPTIVYTHHGGDLNIDHQVTYKAILTACRPLPSIGLKGIYTFETLSSTEWGDFVNNQCFTPNYFVNISSTLDKKLLALKCYDDEMRPFPHARSYEAVKKIAGLRGAQNGFEAAEAFCVIRQLRF